MNAVTKPDRRGFIGGSDIGKLIGVSKYGDAHQLYLEKTGQIEPDPEETKAQRRGRILEPAIAELYAAEHDVKVQPGIIRYLPFGEQYRAQVDRLERDGDHLIPLEIKSASEFTRSRWGPSGTDDAPTEYCAQLHWQMMATGAPYGRIVALLGSDDLRVYTIERDAEVQKYLHDEAVQFWERLEQRVPPEPNYKHPSAADTLARLFNKPSPTEIVKATDIIRSWRDVYIDSGKRASEYEATQKLAKAHLLGYMRNAGVLDFDDGTVFERKELKRKGYTVEATTYIDGRMKKRDPAPAAITHEAA